MRTSRTKRTKPGPPRVGYRQVLRVRDFVLLYVAEAQSIIGDQVARIALSVLVFESTGSTFATGAAFAATLIPALVGGVALSRLGDRFAKQMIMVTSDLIRMICFALMAMRSIPLVVVIVLVIVAGLVSPAFTAAESSYLSGTLTPAQYRTGTALRLSTSQIAQVGGFAVGGVLIATIGARHALLIDAGTFLVSALIIGFGLGRATGRMSAHAGSPMTDGASGSATFHGILADPVLRRLLLLTLLVAFFVVPEGLAVPFGTALGASTGQIGFLLAAGALGAAVGAYCVVRFTRLLRADTTTPLMALACGLPLAVPALVPRFNIAVICLMVSGGLAAYVVDTTTRLILAIPQDRRAHYSGVVNALLLSGQGLAVIGFGAVSEEVTPQTAVAIAGLVGSGLALLLVRRPTPRRVGRHAAGREFGSLPTSRF